MTDATRWPRVERGVRRWIGDRWSLGPQAVYTETGADVPAEHAVVTVAGGESTSDVDRDYIVEIAVHARSRGRALDLSAEIDAAIGLLSADGIDDLYVDTVVVNSAFAIDPVPIASVRRAHATYTLTVRPLG